MTAASRPAERAVGRPAARASRPAASAWSRVRGCGAVAAVLVFLGATVTAPFSMSSAFAAGGEAAAEQRNTQAFIAATGSAEAIDLEVEGAPAAGGAGTGSATRSSGGAGTASAAEYTLAEFQFAGAVNWGGYKFTYYSQSVLPGEGLAIPGRHVNADGYVADGDGYIVLAGSAEKGTVYDTPFGYQGKIYDRGTVGTHLDVYIR